MESPLGDLQIPVKTVLAAELRPEYDVVLLTCKAYDLDSAVAALVSVMAAGCAVIPLLNGIAHLRRLDERFGYANVLGGTCAIQATLRSDGVIHHASTLQRLLFGERDGSTSTRARAFAATLATTKIDWEMSADIEQDLWEKLVFLSALAATTCLFRANVGEILAVQLDGGRPDVLLEPMALGRPRDRHDPGLPRQQPRERDLGGRRRLGLNG